MIGLDHKQPHTDKTHAEIDTQPAVLEIPVSSDRVEEREREKLEIASRSISCLLRRHIDRQAVDFNFALVADGADSVFGLRQKRRKTADDKKKTNSLKRQLKKRAQLTSRAKTATENVDDLRGVGRDA